VAIVIESLILSLAKSFTPTLSLGEGGGERKNLSELSAIELKAALIGSQTLFLTNVYACNSKLHSNT
jgi:hypothetical protein